MQNSSYHKSAALEARTKCRRLIRNIGSSSDEQVTKQIPVKSKTKSLRKVSHKIESRMRKPIRKRNVEKLSSSLQKKCGMK